jgi:hypothetical protein
VVAIMAASCVTAAAAQEDPGSPLTIDFGETVTQSLEAADDTLVDGSSYKMYLFIAEEGDSITIMLKSIDFNAHLFLSDSMDTILETDDDSGGDCNAHLSTVIPTSGTYAVYATSTYPGRAGQFELELHKGMQAPASTKRCGGFFQSKGTIALGDSTEGTLGPPDSKLGGSYYQIWDLEIPEGEAATVDFKSGSFDAVLVLYRGFASALEMNDDGGGACHARLVITGPNFPLKLMLRTGKADETGDYQLRVVPGALPVIAESQCLP